MHLNKIFIYNTISLKINELDFNQFYFISKFIKFDFYSILLIRYINKLKNQIQELILKILKIINLNRLI
jgi:hypothetical protein